MPVLKYFVLENKFRNFFGDIMLEFVHYLYLLALPSGMNWVKAINPCQTATRRIRPLSIVF